MEYAKIILYDDGIFQIIETNSRDFYHQFFFGKYINKCFKYGVVCNNNSFEIHKFKNKLTNKALKEAESRISEYKKEVEALKALKSSVSF